jgi:non-canonical poly(A) RNA polymerase PAPD5/7
MVDSYRPSNNHRPPPPPSSRQPPLPPGPPPPQSMYQFGQNGRDSSFNFQVSQNGPSYPAQRGDSYRPQGSYPFEEQQRAGKHQQTAHQRDGNRRDANGRDRDRRGARNSSRGGRGGYRKAPTADRPLLRMKRGNTPDQLLGMSQHQFRDFDELTDSEEAEMEESDGDQESIASDADQDGDNIHEESRSSENNVSEPPAKKRRVVDEELAPPKWSNPEPYTALPPVSEEAQRKKKDVVKLIRKARIAAEESVSKPSQVATNDDFISFNFDEDEEDEEEEEENNSSQPLSVIGAPSGPRSMRASETQVPQIQATTQEKVTTAPQVVTTITKPVTSVLGQLDDTRKRKRSPELYNVDELRAPVIKRGKGGFEGGHHIVAEWANPPSLDAAVPWIREPHRFTENPGFR